MKKYQLFFTYNFGEDHKNTASIKPIEDTVKIAEKSGYEIINVKTKLFFLFYEIVEYASTIGKIFKSLKPLNEGDLVFVQYPIYSTYRFCNTLKLILNFLGNRKIRTVGFIHDVENLRNFSEKKLKQEVEFLNCFNTLILHNKNMEEVLRKYGLKTNVILLEVFDYLVNDANSNSIINSNLFFGKHVKIVFAGNLNKSSFVNDLHLIKDVRFELYGNGYNNQYAENVFYHGSITPEELNKEMAQYDYGLVWDGKNIEKLDEGEDFSRYMRYNNPFKLSSYISAGLPIITSKDAGIADFVIENNLGIVVNSLNELMNNDIYIDYNLQKQNVLKLKAKLNNGAILSSILEKL